MPGPGMKRKQLRQLSLSNCFKKKAVEGADSDRMEKSVSSNASREDEARDFDNRTSTRADGAHSMASPHYPAADSPLTEDEDRVEDDGGIADSMAKSAPGANACAWKGVPIDTLRSQYRLPGPLKPCPNHTILFRPHLEGNRPPRPFPDAFRDSHDDDHLMMPCSPRARLDDKEQAGSARRRWDVVEEALRAKMTTAEDIREAILTYNKRMTNSWRFEALHALLHEEMSRDESKYFFNTLLPRMVTAALNLPNLVTAPIPILRTGRSHALTMSQQQVACLLANAFFCTFLHRSGRQGGPDIPGVNFFSLFCGPVSPRKFEKLRNLFHYFRRVLIDEMPVGTVTYARRCLESDRMPNWSRLDFGLPEKLHVSSTGTIEDDGDGMLQVDFANKRIGGGVLRNGCVQEEIRFVICPEMLLSRLFTETLDKNESMVIVGAERFSTYSGYANTYKFAGDFKDIAERDSWGRRRTCLVAIDATHFHRSQEQFVPGALKRELDKAFVGFEWDQLPRSVATGNWGCGAFRGNHELKALLQMMACAAAECNVCYFTFGDEELRDNIAEMHRVLTENNIVVKDVWRLICRYWKECVQDKKSPSQTLYDFIHQALKEHEDVV